jgi:ABC-type transport system substrate-binding protein
MKLKFSRNLFAALLVLSLVLTGCSNAVSQSANLSNYQRMKVQADDCSYGGEIRSVEALDAYSVKFTLCTPDASFAQKMSSPVLAIQDKDFLDSHQGDSALLTAEVNGTGPFALIANNPDLPIQLSISSTYWGTPPRITDIYFHWYKESDLTIPQQYRSLGDVFNSIKPRAMASIQNDDNFSGISHDSLNLVYIGFNNKISPMDNVVVRQAVAYMLDTASFTQNYLPSGSVAATQVIPAYAFSGSTTALDWYQVRPKDSIDALGSIGFDFTQQITLAYDSTSSEYLQYPIQLAEAIQLSLESIGLNVVLKPMNTEEFNQAMADGTEMMFIGSYEARYNDGTAFYEIPLLRQTTRFGDPYLVLKQGLLAVQQEASGIARQAKFDELNQAFKDQVPFIPVGYVLQWSYFRNTINSASTNSWFENYEDLANQSLTLQVYDGIRPSSLWPADETDNDTFRVTRLIYDTLVTEGYGGTGLQPSLADSWESSADMLEWTFYLRYNVQFTNGATLDANDVVASFAAIWDASDPNHKGRTGEFLIFQDLFGNLLPSE